MLIFFCMNFNLKRFHKSQIINQKVPNPKALTNPKQNSRKVLRRYEIGRVTGVIGPVLRAANPTTQVLVVINAFKGSYLPQYLDVCIAAATVPVGSQSRAVI